jgi:hypothetical protein
MTTTTMLPHSPETIAYPNPLSKTTPHHVPATSSHFFFFLLLPPSPSPFPFPLGTLLPWYHSPSSSSSSSSSSRNSAAAPAAISWTASKQTSIGPIAPSEEEEEVPGQNNGLKNTTNFQSPQQRSSSPHPVPRKYILK